MRERAVSSVAVVLFGLVPTILGGPIFAIAFIALAVLSFAELMALLQVTPTPVIRSGYVLIALCGAIPLLWRGDQRLPLTIALITLVPLFTAIFVTDQAAVEHWTLAVASLVYLGIPTFAAVDIRETAGESSGWLTSLAASLPFSRDDSGRGLGWILLAILVTWLTDTGAYVVGKSLGRHKLIPRVSPNKTIEGGLGGLTAAVLTAIFCAWAFELHVHPGFAALSGLVLGTIGMLGDLAESMLKRHAGVKDSGSLIPGHGGILDRIDAMLFVIIGTWLVAPLFS
jgi:phosphatidate cytidylyltransferase